MQGSLRLLLVGAPLLFTPYSFAFPGSAPEDVRRAVPRRGKCARTPAKSACSMLPAAGKKCGSRGFFPRIIN
jgi:hypothetical protein